MCECFPCGNVKTFTHLVVLTLSLPECTGQQTDDDIYRASIGAHLWRRSAAVFAHLKSTLVLKKTTTRGSNIHENTREKNTVVWKSRVAAQIAEPNQYIENCDKAFLLIDKCGDVET